MGLLVEKRYLVRQAKIEELMNGVEDVRTPVAECSHTEVIPRPPLALMILRGVVVPLSGSKPGVPVHALRQRLSLWQMLHGRVEAMPTATVVHVSRHGGDILDDACFLPSLELEVVCLGVSLVAHLRGQFRMATSHLHEQFCLEERAHHGLLQIDVLAMRQCHHGNGEVDVVRNGCYDSIEIVGCLLEEFAEVAEAFHLRETAEDFLALLAVEVYVAEGCNLDHTSA